VTDTTLATAPTTTSSRDTYVDFIRAFSLIVVVCWHWCFTIIFFKADGPHATNPIGFTSGMWMLTWLFQVMPLFFFVGGFANLKAYERKQAAGTSMWTFVWSRVKQLAGPALFLIAIWVTIGIVASQFTDWGGLWRSVILVLSPLWFIAVYLLVIVLFPLFYWLHRRFGFLVVIWLAGCAWLVDVIRFRPDGWFHGAWSFGPWLNMIFVWAMCHQLGFWYPKFVAGGKRMGWGLLWAGLFTLMALVYSGVYPGSMVGVPGDKFSNMAPPTFVLIALVVFQVGVILLIRPWVSNKLDTSRRWKRTNETVNRYSMPLFLFHTTGFAIAIGIGFAIGLQTPAGRQALTDHGLDFVNWIGALFGLQPARNPDLLWWLLRPLSFVLPLLCTLPLIWLFGRRWTKPKPVSAAS
jgi:peptidoglycan/LPS O-acetylase OafA/YrhL